MSSDKRTPTPGAGLHPKRSFPRSQQDSAWKDILDDYFRECIEFFYPDIYQKIDWQKQSESLDKELQAIALDAMLGKQFVDKLIRVHSIEGAEQMVLLHIEIQSQKEEEFSLRLFQYYYRLFERYQRPILTLAILTDENLTWNPECYETRVWGFPVLSFHFQTCKLLRYQGQEARLEEMDHLFGLIVLAHLAAQRTKRDLEARYQLKFTLTRRLYEKGYHRDDVINLYKMIDWVLVLPKELESAFKVQIQSLEEEKKMSYITSIERLGREEGFQQGIEQGMQQGQQAIAKRMLLKGVGLKLIQELTGLSQETLQTLLEHEEVE